jgi:hypothetical protein
MHSMQKAIFQLAHVVSTLLENICKFRDFKNLAAGR